MFTGIVTHIGEIERLEPEEAGFWVTVRAAFAAPPDPGASVAHDGICLTVERAWPGGHRVFVGAETLARTTARLWRPGRRVHLERALRLGDELGGHLVFGHVDATAPVLARQPEGSCLRLMIGLPPDLRHLVAVKGSIAVDGVALTVNEVEEDRFAVLLVPATLARTTLGARRPGDPVNLEADMLARYVARQLSLSGT